jgi:hypothetical protein
LPTRGDGERIRFNSAILPLWARRTRSLDTLLPVLYLRGISTGDFQEALTALLGKDAPNLSPAVISRLTAEWQGEYERWQKRDLSARRYVYVNLPLVMSASRIACLGSFDQRHGGADGNPNPHFPKKFKPAISPFAPTCAGPRLKRPPREHQKRLSWLEGLNRPLSFGPGWDDAAFLR